MKIVLLGYMACGKSILGRYLADEMSLPFVDLDFYIEHCEKKKIETIFKEKGVIYFRQIEHIYLKKILNTNKKIVIALGGGTPCYSNNMLAIQNAKTVSIYLKAKIKTLTNRLLEQKIKRPLLDRIENKELDTFVAKHLFERNPYYEQANFTIEIDGKSKKKIVQELVMLLS